MKLTIEVKNPERALKPSKNYLILHNGKEWYITTKEELFKEFDERINRKEKQLSDKMAECDRKLLEMNNQQKKVAKQLLEFGNIIETFISKEDKNK